MSRNNGPKKSKLVPLFITFAILFIVVFALGVIVGKGLGGPDNNTIDRTYDMESEVIEYGAPDDMPEEEEDSDSTDIDSEVVILDEDVQDEDTESSVNEEPETNSGITESKSEDTAQLNKPAQTPKPVTETEKPDIKEVAKEKESPKPQVKKTAPPKKDSQSSKGPMPKIDPKGAFTVQIGAFQNQKEANKLMNSLKSNGYPAFIKQSETPDKKTWYRVRVGTFSTKSDAISYGDKLKQRAPGVKYVFITTNY